MLSTLLMLAAMARVHPVDEICNVMGVSNKPCPIEVYSLLYTSHEHDAKGNLIIMRKGPQGEVVRTTVDRVKWLADKRKELLTQKEKK